MTTIQFLLWINWRLKTSPLRRCRNNDFSIETENLLLGKRDHSAFQLVYNWNAQNNIIYDWFSGNNASYCRTLKYWGKMNTNHYMIFVINYAKTMSPSQWAHDAIVFFIVKTTLRRRFDVIMALLLRRVSAGMWLCRNNDAIRVWA